MSDGVVAERCFAREVEDERTFRGVGVSRRAGFFLLPVGEAVADGRTVVHIQPVVALYVGPFGGRADAGQYEQHRQEGSSHGSGAGPRGLADMGADSVGVYSVDTMAGRHEEAVALTSTKANIGADFRK